MKKLCSSKISEETLAQFERTAGPQGMLDRLRYKLWSVLTCQVIEKLDADAYLSEEIKPVNAAQSSGIAPGFTKAKSTRFSYIKYDSASTAQSEEAKVMCEQLESFINKLGCGQQPDYALKALEECFAWIGKTIRDNQLQRNSQTEHVAERTNE